MSNPTRKKVIGLAKKPAATTVSPFIGPLTPSQQAEGSLPYDPVLRRLILAGREEGALKAAKAKAAKAARAKERQEKLKALRPKALKAKALEAKALEAALAPKAPAFKRQVLEDQTMEEFLSGGEYNWGGNGGYFPREDYSTDMLRMLLGVAERKEQVKAPPSERAIRRSPFVQGFMSEVPPDMGLFYRVVADDIKEGLEIRKAPTTPLPFPDEAPIQDLDMLHRVGDEKKAATADDYRDRIVEREDRIYRLNRAKRGEKQWLASD
jgi:hypothetical protein